MSRSTRWSAVAPLVGNDPGAGMGLHFVVCGALTAIVTLAVYALPMVRRMEADMPDYVVEDGQSPAERTGELMLETAEQSAIRCKIRFFML